MRSDKRRLEDIYWAIRQIQSEFDIQRYEDDSIFRFGKDLPSLEPKIKALIEKVQ